MRRLTATVTALCLAAPMIGVIAGPGPAAAQPSPTAPPDGGELVVPEAVPGEEVCTLDDPRLVEVSGLAAPGDSFVVVNDGTDFADRQGIFFLDEGCQVVDQIGFPSLPRDPEDLALDHDANVLWVGDTGDNAAGGTGEGEPRPTVALWRVDLGGDRTPVIHRFTYPDEPRDAEALLLDGDGTPIIVTKTIGAAELFKPAEEPRPSAGPDDAQALEAVGEFSPLDTGTEHPLGAVAAQVVTGGANAPDGSRVVLRTYTDAYEFDVVEGDVVAAVTGSEPRITVLPDEPLGEAISYTPDGAQFVTVSEVPADSDFTPVLLSYTPTEPAPEEPAAPAEQAGAEGGGAGGGLFDSLQDIINVIAAVGLVGVLLVGAGIFGIVRARRARAAANSDLAGDDGDGGPVTGRARLSEPEPPGGQAGVYTSQTSRPPAAEYGGTQYGGGGAAYSGTEHGGGEYRGTEYGGTEYGGQYQSGTEYGGGNEYGGTEYGGSGPGYGGGGSEYGGRAENGYAGGQYAGGGYPEQQPYDQEWPNGYDHGAQPPAGYPAEAGYPAAPGGYPAQPGHPAQPGYPAAPGSGGGHPGGTYQSGPAGNRDDYSDDPDYPYEFRQQPGRY